jgi:hypothetical protein
MSLISKLAVAALFAAFACVPSLALAAPTPPDNSAVDQYTENVPGAGGNEQSSPNGDDSDGGGAAGTGAPLPPSTGAALSDLGRDGAAAAALAERFTPSDGKKTDGGSDGAAGTEISGESGFGAALGQVLGGGDSEEGLGTGLLVILLAAVFAALGYVAFRRSNQGPTPSQD